uniref:RING-type domain-containing protein n=1 Tax=viral metagenome TaxID=1070528 RepID=A0A6C0LII9_9ZZZZ
MSECVICKDSYTEEKLPFELDCNHQFCKFCVLDFFKRDNRCPLCRQEYVLTVKQKEDKDENLLIPDNMRRVIHMIPFNEHTISIINSIERVSYRICIRLQRIISIMYSPSFVLSYNGEHQIQFNIHTVLILFVTYIFWKVMFYLYI